MCHSSRVTVDISQLRRHISYVRAHASEQCRICQKIVGVKNPRIKMCFSCPNGSNAPGGEGRCGRKSKFVSKDMLDAMLKFVHYQTPISFECKHRSGGVDLNFYTKCVTKVATLSLNGGNESTIYEKWGGGVQK